MIAAALMKLLSLCWRTPAADDGDSAAGREEIDGLIRFRDLGNYGFGDFSMAVAQGNQVLEDQCRLETGPFGAFVGVYDGHGGPEAARYACDHLHLNFRDCASGAEGVTPESIERAFLQTEEGYSSLVSEMWSTRPNMATQGTCCLVGIISHQTLYIANLGDSRVVLGKKLGITGDIAAIQLSTEHNVNIEEARQDIRAQHPNDPQIVVLKHNMWRVKGIIQVSRALGDEYLKHEEFNREPIDAKFRISGQMDMPILSSVPTITSHPLQKNDSFLIFASDGLWEHLTNDQAVDIVHRHSPVGSARRLMKAALQEAARKREMRYSDLRRIDRKVRRHFHDDITVIVLFLNHTLLASRTPSVPALSVRSALEH